MLTNLLQTCYRRKIVCQQTNRIVHWALKSLLMLDLKQSPINTSCAFASYWLNVEMSPFVNTKSKVKKLENKYKQVTRFIFLNSIYKLLLTGNILRFVQQFIYSIKEQLFQMLHLPLLVLKHCHHFCFSLYPCLIIFFLNL